MITHAAVVPHPPLLVPELVPGMVDATAAVRTACVAAARRLAEVAGHWLAIGADACPGRMRPPARGTFAGYGVDVPVTLSRSAPAELTDLPLPALVAAWLRERAGAESVEVELLAVNAGAAGDADRDRLVDRLAAVDGATDPVGLLVLGDGANRHGPRAPGGEDDRAPGFDRAVGAALGTADTAALLALDPELAAELGAGGRVPWQVLAALAAPGRWRARLLYSAAPFGVGYHVAVWERR
ncbi:class III extradiol dioxygenase subunit B-like domain-containing protein [Amycolatopsis arida]|uniref:class III extradiol dioxygenase subunit B-like domain-containing protein n=1 Tax=Amycolatopsis arida TaxID=587909 RepID=UPI000B88DB9E|nr:class III extradiol dioxygenase subunit B-like domain-containing protein [Amycolatopsis arida]